MAHPHRYFTTARIFGQAWSDSALFPEEVRNYVRRLRKIFVELEVPVDLVNKPSRRLLLGVPRRLSGTSPGSRMRWTGLRRPSKPASRHPKDRRHEVAAGPIEKDPAREGPGPEAVLRRWRVSG